MRELANSIVATCCKASATTVKVQPQVHYDTCGSTPVVLYPKLPLHTLLVCCAKSTALNLGRPAQVERALWLPPDALEQALLAFVSVAFAYAFLLAHTLAGLAGLISIPLERRDLRHKHGQHHAALSAPHNNNKGTPRRNRLSTTGM